MVKTFPKNVERKVKKENKINSFKIKFLAPFLGGRVLL